MCIGSVSAFDDNTTLSADDEDALQIEDNIEPIKAKIWYVRS